MQQFPTNSVYPRVFHFAVVKNRYVLMLFLMYIYSPCCDSPLVAKGGSEDINSANKRYITDKTPVKSPFYCKICGFKVISAICLKDVFENITSHVQKELSSRRKHSTLSDFYTNQ